ncbi:MAG: TetR/AcrR family transcriptional regulator [Panacagrimonas sp.]
MSREEQKKDRRTRILDAAEALIRKTGATDFPMTVLAERAALSGPTPYNLFGSKGAILYALLNRSLDDLFSDVARGVHSEDPMELVVEAAQTAAGAFAADPQYYRPLYGFLLGVQDPVHRPAFMERCLVYWNQALAPLVASATQPLAVPVEQISRLLVINFVGSLDQWVQSELDDEQFLTQVLYGTQVQMLAVAGHDRQRGTLIGRLRRLERRLPKHFAIRTAAAVAA